MLHGWRRIQFAFLLEIIVLNHQAIEHANQLRCLAIILYDSNDGEDGMSSFFLDLGFLRDLITSLAVCREYRAVSISDDVRC